MMKFIVEFYPFESAYDGYRVQREKCTKSIEYNSVKELMEIADLRHAVLSKNEFFNVLSKDRNGEYKNKFDLLSNRYLLVVYPSYPKSKSK